MQTTDDEFAQSPALDMTKTSEDGKRAYDSASDNDAEGANNHPTPLLYKVLVWKAERREASISDNTKNNIDLAHVGETLIGQPEKLSDLNTSDSYMQQPEGFADGTTNDEGNEFFGAEAEESEPTTSSPRVTTVKTISASRQPVGGEALSSTSVGDVTTASLTKQEKSSAAPKVKKQPIKDVPVTVVPPPRFNVVLTHATADFDSLAAAVGLAKLWTAQDGQVPTSSNKSSTQKTFFSASHVPTFVVLPRGAHPAVQRFLALHKHLFPIRSLKSLPDDLSGLNRLALVDAQRRDRLGPAEGLLEHAKRIVVVDHHVDQQSDIPATDYVVDKVGSVSALVSEYLKEEGVELTEAEAVSFTDASIVG